MLEGDVIRMWIGSALLSQPSIALQTGIPKLPDRNFPTGGPAQGTCVEPGFSSKRTITGKRGSNAV
jgi:hypothetical protein